MKYKFACIIFSCLWLMQCRQAVPPEDDAGAYIPTAYRLAVPSGFPQPYLSKENPMTEEGVFLGKKLYSDPILSSNGLSCSSCHERSKSFSTGFFINTVGEKISVPPHVNLVFNPDYNWDGGVTDLDILCVGDFEPEFFNTNSDTLFYRLSRHPVYPVLFYRAFGITNFYKLSDDELKRTIAKAITQYMRSLVSADARIDRYYLNKEDFTKEEKYGMEVFFSERGDCFHCHGYPLFTDNLFHNNGINNQFSGMDQGRYRVTHKTSDMGLFSTPTLRNIALTAPYMHDGRFATLEEVVEFYNSGVKFSNTVDPIMTKPGKENGLYLSPYEKNCLVAFLKTLTDTSFINN